MVPLQEVGFDLVHVDLCKKPNWYRTINPRALVPAITYQGRTYIESADICRCGALGYLLEGLQSADKAVAVAELGGIACNLRSAMDIPGLQQAFWDRDMHCITRCSPWLKG